MQNTGCWTKMWSKNPILPPNAHWWRDGGWEGWGRVSLICFDFRFHHLKEFPFPCLTESHIFATQNDVVQ